MSTKTWKDHLLSSGVPLEHTVAQALNSLDMLDVHEYKYLRPDEAGTPTVFSVDMQATHIDTKRDAWLELLVECKYRHPGTRWVFSPEDYEPFFGPSFQESFVTLDRIAVDREVKTSILETFAAKYPLAQRGIELLPGDANSKSLRQAIEQLRYATIDLAMSAISSQADCRVRDAKANPVFVIIPILVTTAELWRLKPDSTIESIRSANEIADVAEEHDIVVYHEPPDNLAQRYTGQRLSSLLDDKRMALCDQLVRENGLHGWQFFVDWFSQHYPSQFVIMKYGRFPDAMQNVVRFFARPDFIGSRSRSTTPTGAG